MNLNMKIKTGKCRKCKEERILDKEDLCIFCTTIYSGPGIEVKEVKVNRGGGTEVKSKTGSIKNPDNFWMSAKR